MKAVSPTGVSAWSGYVKADTPAEPQPTPTAAPTATPEPEPEPQTDPADLAPTGLSAALAEGSGVALSWSAPAEDAGSVTGYEILRAVGEGGMANLSADTASTDTTHTDATATVAGETYAYRVKAIRGENQSQSSNRAAVVIEETSEENTEDSSTEESPAGTVLLSATMTVGTFGDGDELVLGYTTVGGTLGSITDDSFELGGVDTEVQTLALSAGQLSLALSPVPTGDYVLKVDDDSFNSTGGTVDTTAGYMRSWPAASLAWSKAQEVAVELRGTSGAGQPEPASTPEPESTSDGQAPTGLSAALGQGGGVALSWDRP